MIPLLLWLAAKALAAAGAVWAVLDWLARILAVGWLLKVGWRHETEGEEGDGEGSERSDGRVEAGTHCRD